MQGDNAIIAALLAVLILAVVFWGAQKSPRHHERFGGPTYPLDVHQQYPGGPYNPYTVINKEIGLLRGAKHDAYGQPPIWRQPHGLDRYHRSGASLRPERIAEAERESWFAADGEPCARAPTPDAPETLNEGMAVAGVTDTSPIHPGGAPGMDYNGYIADLISDPRTRDNHEQWVKEMGPWSGGPMIVDTMDEAMEATTDFIGLRRPQPVAQYNPLQLTERDTWTFIGNHSFRFNG